MDITAEEIVELFEKDVKARKRLAELLVVEPDIRLAIINAVLRDIATKQDLVELRRAIREDIKGLESRINGLEARINGLEARMNSLESGVSSLEARLDMVVGELDRLFKLVVVSVLGILMSITTTILVRILLP